MDLSDTQRIATIEALISEECILLPMSLNIFYNKNNSLLKLHKSSSSFPSLNLLQIKFYLFSILEIVLSLPLKRKNVSSSRRLLQDVLLSIKLPM